MSDSFAYSLVNGDGDADNAAFSISGDQLLINESPDFETKDAYRIRLQTRDLGGLTHEQNYILNIRDLNENPTAINISNARIDENIIAGSAVATLSTIDPDTNDSFTYSLVNGDEDADNASFSISGNQLLINESPDFETKDTYRIRLKSADIGNLIIEKSFSLSVIDLEEAPLIHIDYDFDGSGDISLQSDAVIGLRKIMGSFPGDSLTNSIIDDSSLTSAGAIEESMNELISLGHLDLNQDGYISPLDDGLMMIYEIKDQIEQFSWLCTNGQSIG